MNATPSSLADLAAQAAGRLNLSLGYDRVWRGRCPVCHYAKNTLQLREHTRGIAIRCEACGQVVGIAAMAGLPPGVIVPAGPNPSKVATALKLWDQAAPASGTLVEAYLRGRGITNPVPSSIRYLPQQRNWDDGQDYPAMVALVQRVPAGDDVESSRAQTALIASGAHFTFLEDYGSEGLVRKAKIKAHKLTLGQ